MLRTSVAAACAAVGIGLITPAVGSADTYYAGGTRGPDKPSTTPQSEAAHMTGDPNAVPIQYPRELWPLIGETPLNESVAQGVHNTPPLEDGDTLVCVSQGCLVADEVAQTAPSGVNIVTYGSPTGPNGVLRQVPPIIPTVPKPTPPTSQDRTNVAIEYDVIADAPDRPNPISWVNAVAGGVKHHSTYDPSMLDRPDNEVTVKRNTAGGTETNVLVRTKDLPLTQPLRDNGIPTYMVDGPLRKVVDSGYSRNDPKNLGDVKRGIERDVSSTKKTLNRAGSDTKKTLDRVGRDLKKALNK